MTMNKCCVEHIRVLEVEIEQAFVRSLLEVLNIYTVNMSQRLKVIYLNNLEAMTLVSSVIISFSNAL